MSEAANGAGQELDLGWMDRTGPWETRAEPGKYGLTIADISIGDYGDAPEVSDNLTGRPRGAAARPASYRIGAYSVRSKNEIWLDNASFLYEEALQRQWSSATDVPWHTIEPATRRRRAGGVPTGHVPHRSGVRRRRRAGPLGGADHA